MANPSQKEFLNSMVFIMQWVRMWEYAKNNYSHCGYFIDIL